MTRLTAFTRQAVFKPQAAFKPQAPARRRRIAALPAVVLAVSSLASLAACATGGSGTAAGAPNVNWYIGNESWLTTAKGVEGVVDACNAQAHGAFHLLPQALPTNPDSQREQLVRRLAAKDSSIDLIGMDVTWTAEFGQAGWVTAFQPGQLTNVGAASAVLAGPWESAHYDGKQFGAPLNSNTRLLWYRKSLLGNRPVPQTWGQLLDTAEQMHTKIQDTGARAESLDVTFNALLESAGGKLVEANADGSTSVALPKEATEKALSIMGRFANSTAAPVGLSNAGEDTNRLAFQQTGAGSAFMINWPFVWPSVVSADPTLAKDYGWAPWPEVVAGQPAHAALGGYNLGISSYSAHKAASLAAINCLTEPSQQRTIAKVGGQPSVLRALATDPEILKDLPMVTLMAKQLETAAPRPVTPNYNDVSLAVRQELHPETSIPTAGSALDSKYDSLRSLIDKALKSEAVL